MTEKELSHAAAIKALEEHGYLFQERCLAEIKSHVRDLLFESEEYPVSVANKDSVIDFIFRNSRGIESYLVFECKRTNPDYATWLFAKATSAESSSENFLATMIERKEGAGPELSRILLRTKNVNSLSFGKGEFVKIGLEVSHERPRQKQKRSKSEGIMDACLQALTGVAGLALQHKQWMVERSQSLRYCYIPIVVTTANLLLTEYTMAKISLATGNIPDEGATTKSVDWVFFNFPVRSDIQVTLPEDGSHGDAGPSEDYRRLFKSKSVAIVQAQKIVEFLKMLQVSNKPAKA